MMRRFIWAQLGVGAFVVILPVILGVPGSAVLFWGNVIAGAVIMLISLWLLFGEI